MGFSEKLNISGRKKLSIDWELTPADTFGMFESWGGKERVRNASERFYYFYIDNWAEPAQLCLMERGIKHAKVLARIDAPQEMIDTCVSGQGKGVFDKNYAIDERLRQWLVKNVVDAEDDSKVIPLEGGAVEESLVTGLPRAGEVKVPERQRLLRRETAFIREGEIKAIVRHGNFFDSQYNPLGVFENCLVDNGDGKTVTDLATGIMWQRSGCDITNIRNVQAYVEELNRARFAGHDDWRLPTLEEGLSLLEPQKNAKGLYLHSCFSKEQPFIFVADQRKPGGYWFVDFKQGTVFWASGTIPGGFGRACRSL